ncbi:MAG TPA: methyltransferase domain-containing protein [Candidatus Eremiobacteraceae bacterium]|nr:methyltransferase domain-containing protein [Candidatus Eremiobacteraceae bacterium]
MTYSLGNTDAEHERLARQAVLFNPLTERVFRSAGVGPGQRVLDLGSGAGDVSLLLADIVGPTGEIVGVERNADSIARARERVQRAHLTNVTFRQGDVADLRDLKSFDAAVGRWILMFVADPAQVVRAVARLVRPGGAIAFHEVSWELCLSKHADLPLSGAAVRLITSTFVKTGGNVEMGFGLPRVFQEAGLPRPSLHMETLTGMEAAFCDWTAAVLVSLRPHIDETSLAEVGDLATLPARMFAEMTEADAVIAWPSMIGAWCVKPA